MIVELFRPTHGCALLEQAAAIRHLQGLLSQNLQQLQKVNSFSGLKAPSAMFVSTDAPEAAQKRIVLINLTEEDKSIVA
jgi:hypothetical protein